MSAYVKDNGNIMGGRAHQYECSSCQYTITTDQRRHNLLFCFHCGVKFGPEPKQEPTEGEWYYTRSVSTDQGKVYSTRDALGRSKLIAQVADVNTQRETNANGHLMAASKKLLAALKTVLQNHHVEDHLSFRQPAVLTQANDAIAEAEKGKQ